MSQPLYQQVKSKLLDQISSMKANSSIPSERALSQKFNVSRMTVRKAIDELVDEGILYRNKTRGTFVAEKHLVRKNSVTEEVSEGESKHLLYMTRRTFEEIAPILNAPIYEDIMRIVMNKQKGNATATVDEMYITYRYYEDNVHDIEGIVAICENKKEYHVTQTFYPMLIPVQFVNILDIPMNTPIIMIRSIYRTLEGKPILLRKTYYNPTIETIEISN